MSLASGTVNNPTIDNLVQSSLENETKYLRLEWIPYSDITEIKPTQIDNVHYAIYKHMFYGEVKEMMIILLLLGSDKTCTPTLVSEFARIYSLPTHRYRNDVNRFRRYTKWLKDRNKNIIGFTKYEDNYYMVVDVKFYHCYSRCSPVWCICGYKELSNGWTSNNKQLDEFIKKSQLQTNSANEHYLE